MRASNLLARMLIHALFEKSGYISWFHAGYKISWLQLRYGDYTKCC